MNACEVGGLVFRYEVDAGIIEDCPNAFIVLQVRLNGDQANTGFGDIEAGKLNRAKHAVDGAKGVHDPSDASDLGTRAVVLAIKASYRCLLRLGLLNGTNEVRAMR